MSKSVIKIGGASGYWGDASSATPQLLASGTLDYLVYDYLAEITMSIMARARAADNSKGYATDFVYSTLKPNLVEIASQGVKVIANAGGVNPQACAREVEKLIATENLDLKVAVVLGDDLLEKKTAFASAGIREMYSDQSFPDENSIVSINAYLGAFPIAKALDAGADIVITGRCVDSAVTLGACIHEFGWGENDFDKLAQGSLAGHILECGTQVTGGNFTDWEMVVDTLCDAGYPIAEISVDGSFITTKPEGTGGVVSVGAVAEQMLYEIGDPQAYVLPDVVCDFSEVKIEELEKNRVKVYGARGHGRPEQYKVSATYTDGFRSGQITTFYGRAADTKAEHFAKNVLKRTRQSLAQKGLPELTEACVEVIGAESHFGAAKKIQHPREVDLKLAVKHPDAKGIGVFLKELAGAYLSGPPGLSGFAGARPKPSPVVRLFSFLLPKNEIEHSVEIAGKSISLKPANLDTRAGKIFTLHKLPSANLPEEIIEVSLESLAWGRSGDKGNKANIGIIARHADFLPYIAQSLSVEYVASYFSHFIDANRQVPVERFYLPGTHALNFLLHDVLGGGGMASLRSDPQGKGYAQLLLSEKVAIPKSLADQHDITVILR